MSLRPPLTREASHTSAYSRAGSRGRQQSSTIDAAAAATPMRALRSSSASAAAARARSGSRRGSAAGWDAHAFIACPKAAAALHPPSTQPPLLTVSQINAMDEITVGCAAGTVRLLSLAHGTFHSRSPSTSPSCTHHADGTAASPEGATTPRHATPHGGRSRRGSHRAPYSLQEAVQCTLTKTALMIRRVTAEAAATPSSSKAKHTAYVAGHTEDGSQNAAADSAPAMSVVLSVPWGAIRRVEATSTTVSVSGEDRLHATLSVSEKEKRTMLLCVLHARAFGTAPPQATRQHAVGATPHDAAAAQLSALSYSRHPSVGYPPSRDRSPGPSTPRGGHPRPHVDPLSALPVTSYDDSAAQSPGTSRGASPECSPRSITTTPTVRASSATRRPAGVMNSDLQAQRRAERKAQRDPRHADMLAALQAVCQRRM